MELEYLGHSAFALRHEDHEILIDPFLSGSPTAPLSAKDVRPTLILVTHGHGDHLGDTVDLAKSHGCPVLAMNEIAIYLQGMGVEALPGNIGGSFRFPFGSVKMFQAIHSSSLEDVGCAGPPCSYLIHIGGRAIYHAGDTALFGDMRLIGEEAAIDAALLPVGGVFTMDMHDSIRAMGLLNAKRLVPMHYATWKEIDIDRDELRSICSGKPFELSMLRPGERLVL